MTENDPYRDKHTGKENVIQNLPLFPESSSRSWLFLRPSSRIWNSRRARVSSILPAACSSRLTAHENENQNENKDENKTKIKRQS